MVGLTGIQQEIQDSLKEAILNSNVQAVKDIFKDNEDSNIQEVLASHSFQACACASASAGFFVSYNIDVRKQIIELIWQKADQRGRDLLCVNAINMPGNLSDEVIQEMEEHKKVRVLDKNLREAIKSLDVNQVKAALENCGEDVKSVLERKVYWNNGDVDALLVYPLKVKYSKELN